MSDPTPTHAPDDPPALFELTRTADPHVLFDLAEMLRAASGRAALGAFQTPHAPEHYLGPDFDALVEDIRLRGILNPVTVAASGNLANGHRRLLAAIKLGLEAVPFVVNFSIDSPAKEAAAVFGSENASCRNALDHGKMLARFMAAHGLDQKQTAAALQMSEAAVSNHLKVLKHSPGVQAAVGDGRLTRHHLAAVAKLSPDRQDELLLAAAARKPVTSARTLQALSKPSRRKAEPKFKRLNYGGIEVLVPWAVSAAELVDAFREGIADVGGRLKHAPKGNLTIKEVFAHE